MPTPLIGAFGPSAVGTEGEMDNEAAGKFAQILSGGLVDAISKL